MSKKNETLENQIKALTANMEKLQYQLNLIEASFLLNTDYEEENEEEEGKVPKEEEEPYLKYLLKNLYRN